MWMSTYVTGKQPLAALLSVILVTTTMEKVLTQFSLFFVSHYSFMHFKGLCEESLMGFTAFGFNAGPHLKDYRIAYHFGKLAVTLSDIQYAFEISLRHLASPLLLPPFSPSPLLLFSPLSLSSPSSSHSCFSYPQTRMRAHVYIVYSMYNLWCEPISSRFSPSLQFFEIFFFFFLVYFLIFQSSASNIL